MIDGEKLQRYLSERPNCHLDCDDDGCLIVVNGVMFMHPKTFIDMIEGAEEDLDLLK